ncbi:hypothetical protein FHS18_003071 [Paenibacillus phyllosphaerae]|uniref:Lipoprotein n=1 Tax=Paenibacillus phyllosphaerae TaxID=274593 RepID=A0A7W5AYB1_9BACL|nr:hypothetical protein [Paenibacillus phyllosphaerae]MBB3111003.1 hypothetical protein [Paenibacillus phyllosphaerae]
MNRLIRLGCLALSVIVLGACSADRITAEDVQHALERQGLEATQIDVAVAEGGEDGDSLQLSGVHPEAFELALPTADMAKPEYVFVYEYETDIARQTAGRSQDLASLRMADLYPNLRQKGNIVVIYWSANKEIPLLDAKFAKAIDKL